MAALEGCCMCCGSLHPFFFSTIPSYSKNSLCTCISFSSGKLHFFSTDASYGIYQWLYTLLSSLCIYHFRMAVASTQGWFSILDLVPLWTKGDSQRHGSTGGWKCCWVPTGLCEFHRICKGRDKQKQFDIICIFIGWNIQVRAWSLLYFFPSSCYFRPPPLVLFCETNLLNTDNNF